MEISFRCPACQATIAAATTLMGEELSCPQCTARLNVPLPAPAPGMKVQSYRLEEPIGEGPLGEVFIATQIYMERQIVFRALTPTFAKSPELVEQFLHDIQALAKVEHPVIVPILDSGQHNGLVYIVTTWVEGFDLAWHLDNEGPLDEWEALVIVRELAGALQDIHERLGLVHGDIKPSNIMITPDGGTRLINFGIHPAGVVVPAHEDDPLGPESPYYMSPQDLGDQRQFSVVSDIYALGASLYHMLCGDVPFPGETAIEVFAKHDTNELPSAQSFDPSISEATDFLLRRALSRRPASRYNSWADFITDIDHLLAGKVPTAIAKTAQKANVSLPAPPDEKQQGFTETFIIDRPMLPKQKGTSPVVLALAIVVIIVIGALTAWVIWTWLSMPAPVAAQSLLPPSACLTG